MKFHLLKAFHLIAIVFWIGPGFGAYWILFRLGRELPEDKRRSLERYYEHVLRMEHLFFGAVLASGLGMLWTVGWNWLGLPWLRAKLCLVGAVFLIETGDIWLAHFLFRHLLRSGEPLNDSHWLRAFQIRRTFYTFTLPLMAALLLGIFYLAVAKTI
jgi:hypothetical protein